MCQILPLQTMIEWGPRPMAVDNSAGMASRSMAILWCRIRLETWNRMAMMALEAVVEAPLRGQTRCRLFSEAKLLKVNKDCPTKWERQSIHCWHGHLSRFFFNSKELQTCTSFSSQFWLSCPSVRRNLHLWSVHLHSCWSSLCWRKLMKTIRGQNLTENSIIVYHNV